MTVQAFPQLIAWLRRHLVVFVVAATIALLVGVVWYLVWTPLGSSWVVRLLVERCIPARELDIRLIEGSLAGGMRLHAVTVAKLPGWWKESRIEIERVELPPLGALLRRHEGIRLHQVVWRETPFAKQATAVRIEGALSGRWIFEDVQMQEAAWFGDGSVLDVQRSEIVWPIQWDRLRIIENARLRLPLSEPIVFTGTQQDDRFSLRLSAKTLEAHEIISLVTRAPAWQSLTGTINDLYVTIDGPVHELMWRGSFHAATLSRDDFTITDCPSVFSLTMRGLPSSLTTNGEITCQSGTVSSRQTVASLLPSKVAFAPTAVGVKNAAFDVQATSAVGGTPIRIALRGTAQHPDLRLTSTPPLPQGVLLAMLVTGKPWKGAQDALTQGVISSDLALDFIDYFVLGGLGSTIAHRVGISGLSLRHNPETNRVGVETTLVDKVSVGVEIEPSTLTNRTPSVSSTSTELSPIESPIPYKVGAEYKVNETTSVQIEGERTVLDTSATSSASTSGEAAASPRPQTDDKVLLKFKKQF